jgi:2-keto-4-pentenoate hydratase/2-oxohepta-3-ene-1,7-dioic acid hydratase in catechol pathway
MNTSTYSDKTSSFGRIFCIGKNYSEHIKELSGAVPEEPVVFMKPWTSLVAPGENVKIPRHGFQLHHEVEVVFRVGTAGEDIPESEALNHIDAVTLGLDLTLRDVQASLKKNGHPWELSKAFDQSAPLGEFISLKEVNDPQHLEFSCSVNGSLRQKGNTGEMIFSLPKLVNFLSGVWHLRPGDLIYTGTPAGVGVLKSRDVAVIASPELGEFSWEFR